MINEWAFSPVGITKAKTSKAMDGIPAAIHPPIIPLKQRLRLESDDLIVVMIILAAFVSIDKLNRPKIRRLAADLGTWSITPLALQRRNTADRRVSPSEAKLHPTQPAPGKPIFSPPACSHIDFPPGADAPQGQV
jgi:hypothetical protein